MLKAMNGNIVSVTGRPRKPSDQGSVENINKLVKRVTADLEETERQSGKIPNWTMLQGNVMGIVNKQCGKGIDSVSSYEAVFGMTYDPPIPCSKNQLRKCVTIEDRMKLVQSPCLDKIARRMYKLDECDDDDSTTDSKDIKQKLDFGLETDSDSDLLDGADDLSDDIDSEQRKGLTKLRTSVNSKKGAKEEKKLETSKDKVVVKVEDKAKMKMKVTKKRQQKEPIVKKVFRRLSIEDAFKGGKSRKHVWEGDSYKFVYPSLYCKECCFVGYHLLMVGDDSYFNDCVNSNRWYETNFIASFAALLAHASHATSSSPIKLIHCQCPGAIIESGMCQTLDASITQVVSIFHGSSHFAVMEADLSEKTIRIFDGLSYKLDTWKPHVVHVLKEQSFLHLIHCQPFSR